MGKQRTPEMWWDRLKLDQATAQLVAARGTEEPGELAAIARAAPDDFRRVFGEKVRAQLAHSLATHLEATKDDERGYGDLLAALEELAGKRPLKAAVNRPPLSYGVLPTPAPDPRAPLPPLLPLPKPGPRLARPRDGDSGE